MSVTFREQIRVLHVDDNPNFVELTKTFLERENDRLTVETATSAEEGLQQLAESTIDCIVSDYEMPGMSGIEFHTAVTEHTPNVPFILYTGKGSEEVASDAISAGVTDYLQKEAGTDDYALLANRIDHAVNSHRRDGKLRFLQTLETELTELSIDFLRAEERGIDSLVDRTLERIGTLVGADRTYVFDVDHEAETLTNTNEWCSEGVEPQIDMLQGIPQETLPWWMQRLERFERVVIPNVSELPPEAEAEQEILQEQNIESLVVTPMISKGELVGFIGFDWIEEQDPWSDELIDILRMVGELITTARTRRARERELRTLRSQYETLVENFPDGAVFLINADLEYVRAGGKGLRKLGLSAGDVEGRTPHALFPESVADTICSHYEDALDGTASTFEQEYGGERYRIQTVPVRSGDEERPHVMAVSRNITDRRERRQELQHTRDLLSNMERLAGVGAWEYDPEGDTLVSTDGINRVHGLDLGTDPTLETLFSYVHPDDRTQLTNRFDECVETGEPYEVDVRLTTPDGEQRWATAHGERVRNGDCEVVRGYIQNITEERRQRLRLEEEAARTEALFDRSPDMIDIHDTDGEILDVNQQLAERTGYLKSELLEMNVWDVDARLTPEEARTLWEGMDPDDRQQVESVYECRDGSRFPVQIHIRRLDIEQKDLFVVISRDITERIEREQELSAQNERLEEFVSIVSHDLRNPLSVATARLELVQDSHESEHLVKALNAIDRSQTLIDDLLWLAREGKRVVEIDSVALASVAESSWQTTETASATLDTDTMRVIRADRSRLQQLFENLYRNAVEHSSVAVTVSVGVTEDGFYVADTGPGIPESERGDVFEAGYSTDEGGTGFGLRIVEQIVDAHGWDITVTESEQGGARFEIIGVEFTGR
ncbi:MAG: PAS sensor histidine kinase [halophilic archaeon J07HX64]|jgi:PAS domain S-box|nr:MAG: PAS sensor histidine kinase [halophilic archaeon J07HX64]